jgi:hypothetical protein
MSYSFKNRGVGVGVGDIKIEESESEVLCTDSTALIQPSALLLNRYVILLHTTAYGLLHD